MATSKSTTAKKPAAKKIKAAATSKTASKPATTQTAMVKKPATILAKTAAPVVEKKPAAAAKAAAPLAPTPEQRYRMVQEAAYFIAERNGFASGSMDYWIAAEAEIEALLSGKK